MLPSALQLVLDADAELRASGSSKGLKAKAKAAANRALAKIKKGKAAKGDTDDDASSDEYVSPVKKRKAPVKKTAPAAIKCVLSGWHLSLAIFPRG